MRDFAIDWFEDYDSNVFDYDIQDEISENVSTLIDTIKKSITAEFEDELIHLRKRVSELQDFAEKKDDYDRKIKRLELELEEERKNSVKIAQKMKLSEFIDLIKKPVWICGGSYEYIYDKCDKCDDDRKIHFKSPSGKDLTEPCNCSEQKYIYKPVQGFLFRVEQSDYYSDRDTPIKNTVFHYIEDIIKIDADSHRFTYHVVYNGEPFDELLGNVYFTNLEDCERYCKYRQSLFGKKR